ncbi:MAG: AAA family ATPase [Desulfobacteraceae bacterium]|nr:AAA family ATPase [Desulfobacteraceae bacterium]
MVLGEKGLGKTFTAIRTAADNPGSIFYIRALAEWTTRWMWSDLITELGFSPERGIEAKFRQLENILLEKEKILIIIDEIDLVLMKRTLINSVRDLFDKTRCPIVLIGYPETENRLRTYGPLIDRVTEHMKFERLTKADVKLAVGTFSEVPFTAAACEELHRKSEKRIRTVRSAVLKLERMARVNCWKEIMPEHVAGYFSQFPREKT